MRWLQFYKNNYLLQYNKFNELRKGDNDLDVLCREYVSLLNSAYELIKLFINYQGLFQFDRRDVIKEAFYIGLIMDGERWINALALAEVYDSGEQEQFYVLFHYYCEDENFKIYEDLNTVFEQYLEEYERIS